MSWRYCSVDQRAGGGAVSVEPSLTGLLPYRNTTLWLQHCPAHHLYQPPAGGQSGREGVLLGQLCCSGEGTQTRHCDNTLHFSQIEHFTAIVLIHFGLKLIFPPPE